MPIRESLWKLLAFSLTVIGFLVYWFLIVWSFLYLLIHSIPRRF